MNNERPKTPQALFTKLAHSYDRINRIASLGNDMRWRKQALEKFNPSEDIKQILDICCGTGSMGEVLRNLYPYSVIHGLDCNHEMIQQIKIKRNYIYNSIHHSFANEIPFSSDSMDLIVISMALNDIENKNAVLDAIHRTLKSDGYFLNLELGIPDNPLLRYLYLFFLKSLIGLRNLLNLKESGHLLDEIIYTPHNSSLISSVEYRGFALHQSFPVAGGLLHCNVFTLK